MNYYIQKGENSNYPKEIITWRLGDKIPEWIVDRAKVNFVDGDGNITLDTKDTTSGGLEIIDSTGLSTLVTLNSKGDFVCIDKDLAGPVFVLNERQLNLLYSNIYCCSCKKNF